MVLSKATKNLKHPSLEQDSWTVRRYLFSDKHDVLIRIVLVYTVSVHILASLGQRRRLIFKFQVLQVSKNKAEF